MPDRHKIQPSKKLGQNFLVDKTAVKRVMNAAKIKETDVILEIGPGSGALTKELVKKAKKVVAVEKDKKMVAILKEELKDYKNVEIISDDIRRFKNWGLKIKNSYKIVANLPFYLTAPVIRKFLESGTPPKEMTLVVQKEVGQRICSKVPEPKRVNPLLRPSPRLGHMNILAVSIQVYADVKIMGYISKKSFWPQPKVDAAIIKILPLKIKSHDRRISSQRRNLFFKVVKAGFSQPRKQLINNLSKSLKLSRAKVEIWLKKNDIRPTQRAETLTVKDWIKLAKSIKI